MSFLREVFSEDGQGSASRVMMGFHAVAGAVFVVHHLYHGHMLADVPWSGLTGFVTAPYAVNKAHAIVDSVADAFKKTT